MFFLEFARIPFGKCSRTGSIVLLCLALVALILAVYTQVGDHQFLNFDDDAYVTKNPHVASGITARNIMWAFTSIESYNWHPITWLSHMADVQLYGMNPRGHHLTSVAIHTTSTLLLFLLLLRLTGALWQSLFVAALFALHPLHVESVAWVAERKDVLSAFFWFLTLLCYAEYVAKRKTSLYILALLFFVLGLMSKPMLVTLPMVMLLLDLWPFGRYRHEEGQGLRQLSGRVIDLTKEKTPFLLFSLLSCAVTIFAQHKGGAISDLAVVPFRLRIENTLVAYVQYIGKTLWPRDLAVLYPYSLSIPLWQVISSLFILLLVSAATIKARHRYPFLTVGWFWFIITLVPVIGLIQVGSQSMADRYTYIPVTGLFIMAAWGVPELAKNMRHRQGILALLAGTVIITAVVLTSHQLGYWRDNISLYRHTLQVTSGNYIIHNNLGFDLAGKGELDAAINEFWKALRINPDYTDAHNNLGIALDALGDPDAAILEYREALHMNPDYTQAHYNLGNSLQTKGDLNAAILEFKEALRINPDYTDAHNNLGTAFAMKGELDAATREFREALRLSPDDRRAYTNLGLVLARKRMQDENRK